MSDLVKPKQSAIDDRIRNAIEKDFFELELTPNEIARKHGVKKDIVFKILRKAKFKNYNDDKIEELALTSDITALSVIENFFASVQHSQKELAFTAMLQQMIREEIAAVIAEEGGVTALSKGENAELMRLQFNNVSKLITLINAAPSQLREYLNMFANILDVQRQVSYVKVITEILSKEDPELYRKIQRALDADPETKKILDLLSDRDIKFYWNNNTGKIDSTRMMEQVNGD